MIRQHKFYLVIVLAFSVIAFDVRAQPKAENLYAQNCMVCHGDDGSGAMPGVSDLTENRNWSTMNELKLVKRLKQGIQSPGATVSMPPKGGNPDLSDDDLKALIHYMRAEFLK